MYFRHLYLFIPFFLLAFSDASLTLYSQSPEYWTGDYGQAREGSPDFNTLLSFNPLAFAGGVGVWMLLVSFFMVIVNRFLAITLSCVATIGHVIGVSSWIDHHDLDNDYQILMMTCVVAGILLSTAIQYTMKQTQNYQPTIKLSFNKRVVLAAVTIAIPIYVFLVPR